MKTIQFGLAQKYDNGRSCDIATNETIAVEVHNSESGSKLWYHVGIINGATINWGTSTEYTAGYKPSVAINNRNQVVEVHETSNKFTNSMYYKVGTVNGNHITWGDDDDYDYGRQPSVAINDDGIVVEVHKSQSYDTLWYRVGKINGNKIKWGDSHQYDKGVSPAISLNNHGIVVEVHKSEGYNTLWYHIGKIEGDKINWGPSIKYQDGITPSVAITNDGQIIEIHESQGITGLWQLTGQLVGDKIKWNTATQFDTGSNPKAAISSSGNTAVQVHEGSKLAIFYSNSALLDTANCIGNQLPAIGHLPLKKMVLTAAHDAGMYAGNILGKTQDYNIYEQLNAGTRYFDLRVNGDLIIYHGIVNGPALKDAINDIKKFFNEGHNEMVILKFSHFDNFSSASYTNLKQLINNHLLNWLVKDIPKGFGRLADAPINQYLTGSGKILVVIDDDWAINYPESGYWVYRDWESNNPEKGHLTVFDIYADTTDFNKMKADQFNKLNNFNGYCKNNTNIPCDLFLLSWTLTPITGVWSYAQDANRALGQELMSKLSPNPHGYFSNLLYLDYAQYARPVLIANILLKKYNKL